MYIEMNCHTHVCFVRSVRWCHITPYRTEQVRGARKRNILIYYIENGYNLSECKNNKKKNYIRWQIFCIILARLAVFFEYIHFFSSFCLLYSQAKWAKQKYCTRHSQCSCYWSRRLWWWKNVATCRYSCIFIFILDFSFFIFLWVASHDNFTRNRIYI